MKKNLLIIAVFVVVVAVGVRFLYPVFAGCNVSVVSKSKIISVKISNKKLFKTFANSLLHCEKGYFKVGHPYEGTGPFFVKSVRIIVDDSKYQNVVYVGKNADGSLGTELSSFDFEFVRGIAIIHLSFTSEFANKNDFIDRTAFELASRIDTLYKYNNFTDRIERNYKKASASYTSKDIGLGVYAK